MKEVVFLNMAKILAEKHPILLNFLFGLKTIFIGHMFNFLLTTRNYEFLLETSSKTLEKNVTI